MDLRISQAINPSTTESATNNKAACSGSKYPGGAGVAVRSSKYLTWRGGGGLIGRWRQPRQMDTMSSVINAILDHSLARTSCKFRTPYGSIC